jgi:co-chaperonin GroES (HSP10)
MNVVKGKLRPIRNNVFVSDMAFDMRVSAGGIVLPNDDGKTEGIRPRWGKVFAIGTEQTDVRVGDWVLVEHGRWTRGISIEDENGDDIIIRRVDTDCILAVSEEKPNDV